MNDTGCSGLVHWNDPEGWDGKGGGRVTPWDLTHGGLNQCMAKPIQYCKVKK